jgi:hypothetical protein
MVEKLTIAEAMEETKRIDKLLDQRFQYISRYCSKKKGTVDEIKNQAEWMKEQVQSARDLMERYKAIKLAIGISNTVNGFDFNGKHYTIAEALLYKNYLSKNGIGKLDQFLNSFNKNTAEAQLANWNNAIARTAQETSKSGAELSKQLEEMNLVAELFYDEKKIIKEKEDLLELMSKMNVLIDKSNHSTSIEI